MNKRKTSRAQAYLILLLTVFLCGFSKSTLTQIETAIIQKNYRKAKALTRDFIAEGPSRVQLNQAQYYLAMSDLNLGEYSQARAGFTELVRETPLADLRDKARIGIVDSYFMANEFEQALGAAEDFIAASPRSDYLSLIYLKKAQANLKMARWHEAKGELRKIISQFPDSPEVGIARQLLEEKQFYAVQVGAFLDRSRAEKLIIELEEKGEYAYIIESLDQNQKKFYRVRVGKLTRLSEAEQLKVKLSQLGYPTRIFP